MTTLITIPDVCVRLGISRATFYRLVEAGDLQPVKIGRSTRVRDKDVEAYIARLIHCDVAKGVAVHAGRSAS